MKDKIIEILKKYGLYQEFGKHHPESYVKKILDDVAQEISSLLKGEGEYYQKVYIKSEADLPRDGIYIAHYKGFDIDSPAGTIISNYDHLNPCKRLNWLERIDWYLQPVSLPDKELIAKSGKKYRSIPDDVDLETWDNMTVAERLHYKNLIITNNNDVVLEEHTVRYLKSEHDTQIKKMTKIFGKKPDVFEQGVNALIAIVEGKVTTTKTQ